VRNLNYGHHFNNMLHCWEKKMLETQKLKHVKQHQSDPVSV
jgi:hypothetical protein